MEKFTGKTNYHSVIQTEFHRNSQRSNVSMGKRHQRQHLKPRSSLVSLVLGTCDGKSSNFWSHQCKQKQQMQSLVSCTVLLFSLVYAQRWGRLWRVTCVWCRKWVCVCVCVCLGISRSVVSDPATLWTVACQAPLSTGFSRQEYWSGLPFPSPGDLPDTGIELGSPALQADSLPPLWTTREAWRKL